jgi:toxin CcdB
MAQFDIHRNPGQSRDAIPYLVVLQSAIYDEYHRRVVIPLVKQSHYTGAHSARFNPVFTVEGTKVVLDPLDMLSMPVDKLGEPVASLAQHGDLIRDAVDELMTRAYG